MNNRLVEFLFAPWRFLRLRPGYIVCSFPLLLAACGNTQMAYVNGDSRDQSFSLVREQAYLGGAWQTAVVVANFPTCQRRYMLEEVKKDKLKMDVYRPQSGVFILNAGKRWYVTEFQSCGFQAYREPPPEPGELVGSFQVRDNELRYTAKTSAKSAESE